MPASWPRSAAPPEFRAGDFDTGFIDRNLAALGAAPQGLDRAAAALGAQKLLAREGARIGATLEREPDEPASPWDSGDGFQLSGARRLALPVLADGESVVAQVVYGPARRRRLPWTASRPRPMPRRSMPAMRSMCCATAARPRSACAISRSTRLGITARGGLVRAPMHGKVLALLVEQGARVARGQRLAIIEAMKMEHTLTAPLDGSVAEIAVAAGRQVAEGAKVMVIERRNKSRVGSQQCRFISSSSASAPTSIADLEDWIKLKLKEKEARGKKPEHIHTTRMVPKRAEEISTAARSTG